MKTRQDDGAARLRDEWRVVTVSLAMLALVIGALNLTWRLDQTLFDAALRITGRAASPDIVIVAIDDESVAAIGRWPWPRGVHATLLERIVGAGPRAIGLDLLLAEPDADPAQDAALGAALRKAGNVVLPVAFVAGPDGVREMLPVAALRDAARLGHIDAELDADSILRSAWLRAGPGAPSRPHFALAMLEAAGEKPRLPPVTLPAPARGDNPGAWVRDQRMLIRFAGPPGTVRRIPFVHLLRGDVAPDVLRDKYVLIGATALGIGDAFATPVSGRERPMPGIEINASVLDALRAGDTLRAVGPAWIGLGAALLAIGMLVAMRRLQPRAALTASAGCALAAAPLSVLLFAGGIWIAPATFILVAVLAYPLWSWRRLEATLRFFDRELARLRGSETRALSGNPPAAAQKTAHGDDFIAHRIGAIRLAADRLQAAQRLMAETLAALPEAVFVTRGDGTVELANPRALALAGANELAAVRGSGLAQLLVRLAPQEVPTWAALLERAAASSSTVVTEAHGPAVGDFLVRCAPLRDSAALLGGTPGFVVALADVTRLKAAERQRDDVLGFVSHDIRSPQASLLSLVQLRRAGQLDLGEDALLDHVEDLARRSLELADEFVQVARAEAKPLALEDIEPKLLLDEALREIGPQALGKNVVLERGGNGALPLLRVERLLLVRALVNLLNNAVKFSRAGGTVTATLAARDGGCVFTVQDRGAGIAQEDLARLFQRYHRAEAGSVTRLQPGIGLGLVFVDAVARRHGGRVSVESRLGEGACFELFVPAGASERRA